MIKVFAVAAVIAAGSASVFGQAPPPSPSVTRTITVSAVIKAIDTSTRSITLQADSGETETFTAGPAVTRFDQLKVGDTIKATYSESVVVELRKPGAAAGAAAAVAGERLKNVPGGYVGAVQRATVTVKAVDMNAPSITVAAADGRTMTRKIADKKNLEGIKVGDQLDITYTQSLLVNAEAAKK